MVRNPMNNEQPSKLPVYKGDRHPEHTKNTRPPVSKSESDAQNNPPYAIHTEDFLFYRYFFIFSGNFSFLNRHG